MSHTPRELLQLAPTAAPNPQAAVERLDPDTELLMLMAGHLGPRDLSALCHIVRRTVEICETEGEETALAVLEQISGVLQNRAADA